MADKYIAPTGNDATGDGSAGNPYLTVNKCIADTSSPLAAGEYIYALAGTYSYSSYQTVAPISGASDSNPMHLEVYTTTPGDKVGAAVFDFTGYSGVFGGMNVTGSYWLFVGIESNNGPTKGWQTSSINVSRFLRCASRNNSGQGWNCSSPNVKILLVDCEITDNTGDGVYGSPYATVLYGCKFDGNGGYDIRNIAAAIRCSFSNNSANYATKSVIGTFECTSYNHSHATYGAAYELTYAEVAINCVSLNDKYPFKGSASGLAINCGAYGYTTLNPDSVPTIGTITTDPGMSGPTSGDYTPSNTDYIGSGYPSEVDATTTNINIGLAQTTGSGGSAYSLPLSGYCNGVTVKEMNTIYPGRENAIGIKVYEDGVRRTDLTALTRCRVIFGGVEVDSNEAGTSAAFDLAYDDADGNDVILLDFGELASTLPEGEWSATIIIYEPGRTAGFVCEEGFPIRIKTPQTGTVLTS